MGFGDSASIKVWKNRLGNSFKDASRVFRRFYDEALSEHVVFKGLSPNQLIEWQVNATGRERHHILRLAQNWVNDKHLRFNSKRIMLSYIRSFFMHNQAPLPQDRSFRMKGDIAPVEGRLTFEAFRRLVHNSNKMYRSVFLMMAAGLMGVGELVYVSDHLWREVLEALTKNVGEFKLVLPGRKRNHNRKNFYILLDTNADWANAYREYLRSSPHEVTKALFKNERGRPLHTYNISFYFHQRAIETGAIRQFTPECQKCHGVTVKTLGFQKKLKKIVYKCKKCGTTNWAHEMEISTSVRYGVNPHEIRDLMRSRWQVSGADPLVAEFFLGHTIDSNNYNKFTKYEQWYCNQEYRKALPWLNVLSKDPSKIDRIEIDERLRTRDEEIEVLRMELEIIKISLDDPILLKALKDRREKRRRREE